MNVDRIVTDDGTRPYPVYQIVLKNESAGRLNQSFDDFKRAAANGNHVSARAQFAPCEIDLPLSRFVYQ
jgi:hypothetical protein